ncbi:MAG TPA: PE family protein, partial [Verrucomicrobiales bacterium]|nr:PE family protein [Verrucomicrobiales bacterium]
HGRRTHERAGGGAHGARPGPAGNGAGAGGRGHGGEQSAFMDGRGAAA